MEDCSLKVKSESILGRIVGEKKVGVSPVLNLSKNRQGIFIFHQEDSHPGDKVSCVPDPNLRCHIKYKENVYRSTVR